VRTHELHREGVRLRLQEQPFVLLAVMLDHPGELLTRDELRRHLWPQGTFVDFEHGVNAAVRRLRAVLGDNAQSPRFIETLPRRGYRFIAQVERIEDSGVNQLKFTCENRVRLAVLPFSNLDAIGVPESFVGGLTEELVTELGRVSCHRLGIIARSSYGGFNRADWTVSDIGATLKAQYLIEGTVRGGAPGVRITVQLIESQSETQLWAESYERRLTDTLPIQVDVASQIAKQVALELLPGRGNRNDAAQEQDTNEDSNETEQG